MNRPALCFEQLSARLIEKFKLRLPRPLPTEGCWLWRGRLLNGYGYVRSGREFQRAPRISYVLYNGDIPEGLLVRHTCNNTCCIAPYHLILGTELDNQRDRYREVTA